MNPSTILVTGASGQQGGAVARSLLGQGQPIRVMSRSKDKLQTLQELGAEIVAADMNDPDSLEAAMSNIKKAFLVTTPFEAGFEAEVQQGKNFIDAAKNRGVEHLVFTSVGSANTHTGIPHFDTKFQIEQYIKQTGIPFTIIRPVFFMENFGSPWFLPAIQKGTLALPVHPDVSVHMVSLDVIGAFIAAAFMRPSEFIGQEIEIASDRLTFPEAMKKLSEASGKKIAYQELPSDQAESMFGSDLTINFLWFNEKGFAADLTALKKWGIPLVTFKEHLASVGWVKKV